MGEKMNVGEICTRTTVFAYKSMSVSDAARLMLEQHVGSLVVVEETDKGRVIVGILTDRDIVVAVVAYEFDAKAMTVADFMSSKLASCRTEDSVADVLSLMRHHGVRRLPVTDMHGTLIGIVALDDVLEILAEELQSAVQVIASERKREADLRG